MNHVVTLITSPERANITHRHIDQARTILDLAGCPSKAPFWLAENISCDIEFDSTGPTRSLKILKEGIPEELARDEMVRKVYLGKNFEFKKKNI